MTVFVVDDDQAVRDSLADLVDSIGLASKTFSTAQAFLKQCTCDDCGCLVLDIRMPGMSGLELQKELVRRNNMLPVIFITGHGDIPMAVNAMRQGAQDFIQKPFREQELLDCIYLAFETSTKKQAAQLECLSVKERVHALTPRETEVMNMIVAGNSNKVIAIDLCLSQRTIEVHRSNVMEKLKVRSLADLVRVVTRASIG